MLLALLQPQYDSAPLAGFPAHLMDKLQLVLDGQESKTT